MFRLPVLIALLATAATPAMARDCAPVETAPGVKVRPAGCPAPSAKPGETGWVRGKDGHSFHFGQTDLTVRGSLAIEAGTSRRN